VLVFDMVRGTMKGPTRRAPFSRSVSKDRSMFWVDEPPEPIMMPVRSFETSCSVSPESSMASPMAR
jgi:hypothetical protein